MILAVIIGCYF